MTRQPGSAIALAVLGVALSAAVADDAAVVRGPYLQQASDSRIVVRWRTDVETDSTVIYGAATELSGGASQQPAAGSLNRTAHQPGSTTEHSVTIEELSPNTRYYYAVGHGQGAAFVPLSGNDAEHFFDTASSPGTPKPTRIWVVGDGGAPGPVIENVRDSYLAWTGNVLNGGVDARHTEFWLLLGDNAYSHGTDSQYQTYFFDVHQQLLRSSAVWPTPGNHELFDPESETFPYFDIFELPTAGESGGLPSGTEQYYSFDYANIHFVSLDSALYPTGLLHFSPMLDWLDDDLAATDRQWIIVYFHHPPYSKGSHDSDDPQDSGGRMFDMRMQVLPILESHGVDLVLSGHSHSYERSFLIDGHYGDSSTFNPSAHAIDPGDGDPQGDGAYQAQGAGTVYTVSGHSSKRSTGVAEVLNGEEGEPPHPVMATSLWLFGSSVIDVDGNRLDALMLDDGGVVQDRFTLIKGAAPQPPEAEFEAQLMTQLAPLEVQFSDASQNEPTSWQWDFEEDGTIDSVVPNPVAQYPEPGLYSVSLTVSNSEGTDQELKTDLICSTAGAPQPVAGLRIGSDKSTLTWEDEFRATAYDVARGDLAQVIASGGDFRNAAGCVGTVAEPSSVDDQPPAAGGGLFFYLVRGVNCLPQTGSYDTGGDASQAGSRDYSLQGEGGGCACPAGDDEDGDGYCTAFDNCPQVADQTLRDSDADGAGDACDDCPFDALDDDDGDSVCGDVDNCPSLFNVEQLDTDGDLTGDACDDDDDGDGVVDVEDQAPLDAYACRDADADGCDDCVSGSDAPQNDGIDIDGDGACDAFDSCIDVDGDGLGNGQSANVGCADPAIDIDDDDGSVCNDVDSDGCDDCSSGQWDPMADGQDIDVDGICDLTDNCRAEANPEQSNGDGDDLGDACDSCTDVDGDGFGDPEYPQNSCPIDNCPDSSNPGQLDSDADGPGDACDICPLDPLNDSDFDLVCGDVDNCPWVANASQADLDGDGEGDSCDLCTDMDQDGHGDPGFPGNACATDNCPGNPNPNQNDTDGDGLGNACDICPFDVANDVDGDSVCGSLDNCPDSPNPSQNDSDQDGLGNACDSCPFDPENDTDGDLICGNADNCPADANPDQTNSDTDPRGDACDDDDDNDGVVDTADCSPLRAGVADPPGELGPTLRLGKVDAMLQLDWTPVPQGHLANVYSGDVGDAVFGCEAAELPQPQAMLSAAQSPGELTFYVVSPRNVCGEPLPAMVSTPCDSLDLDTDTDSIPDGADNCPLVANPLQEDLDGDWVGDACDVCPGPDEDCVR